MQKQITLCALSMDSHAAEIIDAVHGAGTSLSILRRAFGLSENSRFEQNRIRGMTAFVMDESDYKRLGGNLFSSKAEPVLASYLSLMTSAQLDSIKESHLVKFLIDEALLPIWKAGKLNAEDRRALISDDLGL